jgi:hypothetical protein
MMSRNTASMFHWTRRPRRAAQVSAIPNPLHRVFKLLRLGDVNPAPQSANRFQRA